MPGRPLRTHCASCGVELDGSNAYRRGVAASGNGFRIRCKACEKTRRRPAALVCAVCEQPFSLVGQPKAGRSAVERLRQSVCRPCRNGLAAFPEDAAKLRRAATLLEQEGSHHHPQDLL